MSIAPVPAAIAVVGVFALAVMFAAWKPWRDPISEWTRRRFTRQSYTLLAMAVVLAVACTVEGKPDGYIAVALCVVIAGAVLLWVKNAP